MKINMNILLLIVLLSTTSIHARTWSQYLAIQYNYLAQKMTGNYAYTLNTTKSRIPYNELMRSFYNQLKSYIDQTKSLTPAEKANVRNNLNAKFYKTVNLIAQSPHGEKIAKNFKTYFPHFFYLRGITNVTKEYIFGELKNRLALIETNADLERHFQDLPRIAKK